MQLLPHGLSPLAALPCLCPESPAGLSPDAIAAARAEPACSPAVFMHRIPCPYSMGRGFLLSAEYVSLSLADEILPHWFKGRISAIAYRYKTQTPKPLGTASGSSDSRCRRYSAVRQDVCRWNQWRQISVDKLRKQLPPGSARGSNWVQAQPAAGINGGKYPSTSCESSCHRAQSGAAIGCRLSLPLESMAANIRRQVAAAVGCCNLQRVSYYLRALPAGPTRAVA